MAERVDIIVGKNKHVCELRALPGEGCCVRLDDGSEVIVERVVYPAGRRIVLECKQDKPAPKKAKPAPKPAAKPEPAEEGKERGIVDSKAPFKV